MKSEPLDLKSIRERLDRKQSGYLSAQATPNAAALRREEEELLSQGYRQAFSVDGDRILHARAYARYIDKTQVFYLVRNDHITHRVLHVQLVSKISRTIGRFLGLNEDLIEAISLGHDIGHTNIQSVQFLDRVERKGRGWNLCLQTLDGILCHDGEVHNQALAPRPAKTFEVLSAEMAAKKADARAELMPMTLEGCVVRMADTVAYIGRDIEDAIRLHLIQRTDIPAACAQVLGDSNGTIVFNLVSDILRNSYEQGSVRFSPEISLALRELKRFNLERIYLNPAMKPHALRIRDLFKRLFEQFLEDFIRRREDSVLFNGFLNGMSADYIGRHRPAEIVRDFIAGMTDQYFLSQCPPELRPNFIECLA